MSLWGSVLGSVAGSLAGGLFGAQSAKKQADRQNQWEEYMSNTAHQREVADLKAAGLNPILSATGGNGASTPVAANAVGAVADAETGAANNAASTIRDQLGLAKIQTDSQVRLNDDTGQNQRMQSSESFQRIQNLFEQEKQLKLQTARANDEQYIWHNIVAPVAAEVQPRMLWQQYYNSQKQGQLFDAQIQQANAASAESIARVAAGVYPAQANSYNAGADASEASADNSTQQARLARQNADFYDNLPGGSSGAVSAGIHGIGTLIGLIK